MFSIAAPHYKQAFKYCHKILTRLYFLPLKTLPCLSILLLFLKESRDCRKTNRASFTVKRRSVTMVTDVMGILLLSQTERKRRFQL